ncbi:MAG: hypothetical protein VCF24_13090 [Candidatus Latescibacterota bacterium]|jgi:hypothetical protein
MTAPSYASIDPKLQDHLDALGFHSVGSYRIWCHKQGLDKRLAKTDEQLVDEAALFLRLQAKAQPSPKKGHRPGTVRTLTKIYNGARGGWTHPEAMFDAAADQAERDALLRILVHLETYTGISWWVGARLAKHHAEWLRPVEEWYPHGENVELQVGALANHLLARYDAPLFMGSLARRRRHGQTVSELVSAHRAGRQHSLDGYRDPPHPAYGTRLPEST